MCRPGERSGWAAARLKEEYASAKAEGKEEFEFDGYTFLIGYASRPLTQRIFTSSALTIGNSNW